MYYIEGKIISGTFDDDVNEFSIQKVKDFSTQSILKETQCQNLLQYLSRTANDSDGQIVTLYDQMPIRLSQGEIQQLLLDLKEIQDMYK